MSKIAYTVCSANHLAYAKTMADSFIQFNKEYDVFICLVDKINDRFDVDFFRPYQLVEIDQIGIKELPKMSVQYSLIELNCAVKPFMAKYLFEKYSPETILYIDSDILFFHDVDVVEQQLQNHSLFITPHYTTPISDDKLLLERELLRSGLYNAGFIGMKKSSETFQFLNWWSDRLIDQCYYNFAEGMGVDQAWLNIVPLFFKEVCVANHKGLNVAYWNLHERKLSIHNEMVFINEKEPLIFLHISGYKVETPEILSKHQNRFILSELTVLGLLLEKYRNLVMANKYEIFSKLTCFYAKPIKKSTGLMATINKILKPIQLKLIKL